MNKLVKVTLGDLKLIFRDASLRIFLVLPIFMILFVVLVIPDVVTRFPVLKEYLRIILMASSVQGSIMFGAIYSFVLVDEKDKQVSKVYGVLPVSKAWFVISRLLFPYAFSTAFAFVLLLTQPFFVLPVIKTLFYSTLTGLISSMIVLWVAIMSKNKMEAMTWQKLSNTPIMIPLLALIVPSYGYLFAISPTFWGFQAFDAMIEGGTFYPNIFVGFAFSIALLIWLTRKFSKIHFV